MELGSPRQRCFLAVLLLAAGRQVDIDGLVECLWAAEPPPSARNLLATHASRLRRILADAAGAQAPELRFTDGGYAVLCDLEQVDAHRARQLRDAAKVAMRDRKPDLADAHLAAALALCTGTPLAGIPGDWAERTRSLLVRERLDMLVERSRIRLSLGRHAEVVTELAAEVDAHPLEEDLAAPYLLALYRCGRSADALAAYHGLRDRVRAEFGVEPAAELRQLHQRILQQDPALAGRSPEAPRPGRLPPEVADFTGRTAEVRQLVELLTSGCREGRASVAVCTGSAGIGKTALAVHVGHRLRGQFQDGQLYVDLRGSGASPVDPVDALADLLGGLGVAPAAQAPDADGRARQLRSRLAGRRVLLLLDDVAAADQVRPLLAAGPGCAALVTSRRHLADLGADRVLELPALSPPEAVTLLATIAGGSRCAAERDQACAIVEHCSRLPLAVRIAGARLAARPHWPLRRLARRLADEHRRLSELHSDDAAVRVSFAIGYEALPPALQRALCMFAAIDAPDLADWALAALLDLTTNDATELAEHLVDVRLLDTVETAGQVRYRCHDLVRLFAKERLAGEIDTATETTAVRRVVDAAIALATLTTGVLLRGRRCATAPATRYRVAAEVSKRIRSAAHEWMLSEQHLLMALTRDTHRREWWARTCALADRLMYLIEIGNAGPAWQHVQDLAIDAGSRQADRISQARAHTAVAYRLWMHGEWAQAQRHIDSADTALDGDDEYERACIDYVHSLLLWERGQWAENFAILRRCLAVFRHHGDADREARVLCNLGYAYSARGEFDIALEHLQSSLAMFRTGGFRLNEANVLVQIGAALAVQREIDDAVDHITAGLAIFEQYHAQRPRAQALFQLGSIYTHQRRYAEANAALEQALELVREFGDRQGEGIILYKLGAVRIQVGEPDPAISVLAKARAIFDDLDAKQWQARTQQELGNAYAALDNTGKALQAWLNAERIYNDLGMPEALHVKQLVDTAGRRSDGRL